jgi:mono/diheme cytochrome c family protein
MNIRKWLPIVALASLAVLTVCAREQAAAGDPPQSGDKGIGPVKDLKLGPVDEKLAARGKELFDGKCAACHGLDTVIAGPALGSVLKQKRPEFVMNMMLNTAEMEAKNPAIKKQAAKFGMSMPSPGLAEDQARAILEYLRTTGK